MRLAWRNLVQDRTRLGLSVAGVALAVMLILILTGFVSGMGQQVSRYLDHAPGSIVLVQAGTRGASSVLPATTVDAARAVAGVASAVPVISQYAVLDLGQTKQFIAVVGYDPALGGGPWALREGRLPAADDEVVLDGVLADRRGVRLNSGFELMGQTFTVVGLSAGTTTWMTSYLFMRLGAAQRLFGAPGAVSLVLVTPAAGVSPEELRSRLASIPGSDAMLKSDLIATTRSTYLSVFGAPLQIMAAIASLVGTLVVGMVIYTATLERQREYGVLKAVGARNRVLYRVVGIQALVAAVAGSVLGLGLALGTAQLVMGLRPQFLIAVEPASAGLALAAGVGMALLAALFPARMLAHLAPAEVFRK
jgi:putative ABC transport system permease protein